eukprot:759465-Hanusia_phi.AAC.2
MALTQALRYDVADEPQLACFLIEVGKDDQERLLSLCAASCKEHRDCDGPLLVPDGREIQVVERPERRGRGRGRGRGGEVKGSALDQGTDKDKGDWGSTTEKWRERGGQGKGKREEKRRREEIKEGYDRQASNCSLFRSKFLNELQRSETELASGVKLYDALRRQETFVR